MKRCFVFSLLMLLLLSVSALAYEYTPDADVSFMEPFSQAPINTQPGYACQTDRALYLFSPEIEETERDAFINRQEALLALLNEKDFTVHVIPDYAPWARSEDRCLFLSPQDETGLSQAIAALQAIHGEYANYGLIFGTADALCKAAGLPGHELRYNDRGMLRFYNDESNLSAFMLLYPSFIDFFEYEESAPQVQDMAVRFCTYLAEKDQLLPLLQEKDGEKFNQAFIPLMNAFLQDAQAETQLYTHLPALQFGSAGASYPLVISTAHGEWYIEKEFVDPYDYWLEWDFEELFNAVWKMQDDLSKADQALGLSPQKRQFLFAAPKDDAAISIYTHHAGNGPLLLSGIESMVHEYIHACTDGWYQGDNAWFLTELAATYFEIQGQKNPQNELIYTLWYDLTDEQEEYWGPVVEAMENGDPLPYWPDPDQIYHYLCFAHEQYDLFTPSSRTLNAIRSFAYYLEENYDLALVGRILQAGNPDQILGKTWADLQVEWQQYLNTAHGSGVDQSL